MSWAARGGYMEILCFLWDRGPMTAEEIRTLLPNISKANYQTIVKKLTVSEHGLLFNERLERERLKSIELFEKRSKAGQKGGIAKAKKLANATNLINQNSSKPLAVDSDTDNDKYLHPKKDVNTKKGGSSSKPKRIKEDPLFINKHPDGTVINEEEVTLEWIIDQWNSIEGVKEAVEPEIPTRFRAQIRERMKEKKNKAYWVLLFEKVRNSSYLCGKKVDWSADLPWACGPENRDKILANRYLDHQPQKQKAQFDRMFPKKDGGKDA